jgi:hypothetical protein
VGRKKRKKPPKEKEPGKIKQPMNPRLVLLIGMILPGYGHLINGQPKRGFTFLFFTLILAWITYNLTSPEHSFLGRYAGGIFIYALGFMDAYKWARYRYEYFKIHHTLPGDLPR